MIEFDVETTGLQWYCHELFLVQFLQTGMDKAVIFRHPQDREAIQRWLEQDDEYRAWNSKFDLHFLEAAGYTLPPQSLWRDGEITSRLIDDRRSTHALQKVGNDMFGTEDPWPVGAGEELELGPEGVKPWIAQETRDRRSVSKKTGTRFVRPNYSDVPDDIMWPYAAHDVELQRRICEQLDPKLPDEVQQTADLENLVLPALYDTEKLGMGIDEKGALRFEKELERELDEITSKARKLAGDEDFNPNSSQQLQAALEARGVDLSHAPATKRKGGRSMEAAVLAGLDDELAVTVERLGSTTALYTNFIRPLLHDEPDTPKGFIGRTLAADGRLHADLRQCGARTGRMSSSPNVQNWPRDDLRMRHLVCADEGKKLVAVDLDSIELRLFAAFLGKNSKLYGMLMSPDADLHTYTAKTIGLKDRDRGGGIVESARQRGKKFNYERIYGGGIRAIMKWHGVPQNVARQMLRAYEDAFPEFGEFKNDLEITLEERGYVKTLWGRRHRVKDRRWADRESYKFVCYLVQGTAADLFKESVVRVHQLGIPMIALTHDEILAEVDAADAVEAEALIRNAMIDHPRIAKRVPLDAEGKIVDRWSQAKNPEFDPGW